MKFKAVRKPIEVWATKYRENTYVDELLKFMKEKGQNATFDSKSKIINIVSEKGNMKLPVGNYLVWEITTNNKFHSVDAEIFAKTYKRVREVHPCLLRKVMRLKLFM